MACGSAGRAAGRHRAVGRGPIMAAYCLIAQWPMWKPGDIGLGSRDLIVTLSSSQRPSSSPLSRAPAHRPRARHGSFRVAGELGQRVEDRAAAMFAALEGPLAACWPCGPCYVIRRPGRAAVRRHHVRVVVQVQRIACLQVVTSLPQWHGLPSDTPWLAWWPERRLLVAQGSTTTGSSCCRAAVLALSPGWPGSTGPTAGSCVPSW